LKIYSHYGVNEFVVCCGYKGYVIKEYFANYFLHQSDVTFDMERNTVKVHHKRAEPWKVTLVDTGDDTQTGGRLLRVADYIRDEDTFCMTYGDGVTDVDISEVIAFHRAHGKAATVTATLPAGRFGALEIDDGRVLSFKEKPRGDGGLINGGFFVLSPKVLDFISDESTVWEQEPLYGLAAQGELMAFEHTGFWQPMDTIRERNLLEELWVSNKAPWRKWD
jgi:glucose-1-phosphate cytidylyltransferase